MAIRYTLRHGATGEITLDNVMAGILKADKWVNGDGTENYKCRAWVNFNGTGTVAIRASYNVSSITDNSTGNYTVNLTNSMQDNNYTVIGSCGDASGTSNGEIVFSARSLSVSNFIAFVCKASAGMMDSANSSIAVFR